MEQMSDGEPTSVVLRDRESTIQEWSERITCYLSRFLRVVSRHWLLGANLFMALYVGLPLAAPVLHQLGYTRAGSMVHTIFRPFCHQRADRSFFFFGDQLHYTFDELAARLQVEAVPQRFAGAEGIGYKVAICERDVAVYGMMLLAGLVFHLVRRRLRPLNMRRFVALCVPMAVDGLGQLIGLWTSTWWSRAITGSLFGLACVWLVYPYLEEGMREVNEQMRVTLRALDERDAQSNSC